MTPKFLLFYTKILVILHQDSCYFTPKILLFYITIFLILHQKFCIFTPNFFLFLHQIFLHQKFCFFTPIFITPKILLLLHYFFAENFKISKSKHWCKKVDPLKYVKPAYFLYVYMLFSAFKTYPFLTYKINN